MEKEKCPVCEEKHRVIDADRYLDEYLSSLPDDIRAPEKVYSKRLAVCGGCRYLSGMLCSQCGCFVRARAAKMKASCPAPGGPLWEE